jgi:hypothetical protein
MKNYIIILILVLVTNVAFCQNSKNLTILGRIGYENNFFDSIHKSVKSQLQCFERSYFFHISFQLDANKNAYNHQIVENPRIPVPQAVKSYMLNILKVADGKWQYKTEPKVEDTEYVILISLRKLNQSIAEREKDEAPVYEESLKGPHMDDVNKKTKGMFDVLHIYLGY